MCWWCVKGVMNDVEQMNETWSSNLRQVREMGLGAIYVWLMS